MTFGMMALAVSNGTEPAITLTNRSPSSLAIEPGDASASYGLLSNGDVTVQGADVDNWIAAGFAPGAYECQLIHNSGTAPTGSALSTWLALSSNRAWFVNRTTVGTNVSNCTIQIRLAGVVKASATISFDATVEI